MGLGNPDDAETPILSCCGCENEIEISVWLVGLQFLAADAVNPGLPKWPVRCSGSPAFRYGP